MIRRRSFALILTIVFSLNSSVALASTSVDEKKEQQKVNESKIGKLNEENGNLQKEKNSVEKELEGLTTSIMEKTNVINEKDKNIKNIEDNVSVLQNKVSSIESELSELKNSIESKEKEYEEKEELLGERLRAIYKSNIYNQLVVVLIESENFSDLITTFTNIRKMVTYDKSLMDETENLKKELQQSEEKLKSDKNDLDNKKLELNSSKESLMNEKKKLESAREELKLIENEKEAKNNSLSTSQKQIQGQIYELEVMNDSIQKEINNIINAANSGSNGGQVTPSTGGWIYPVNDPITSPFGYRTHPVTGEQKLHTGTDFGSAMGTPVKAVKDGKVIFAGVNAGYGNCVIIDHGGGIQTLYAHNSELNVSEGQTVKQGQVVSKVGSTGMSTGPHLHLEFRVNGDFKDPMSYLK